MELDESGLLIPGQKKKKKKKERRDWEGVSIAGVIGGRAAFKLQRNDWRPISTANEAGW